VLREIRSFCRNEDVNSLNVYLSPEAASFIYEEEKASIEYIENTLKTKVNLIANPDFSIDRFQVVKA
jgi:hypothetical protein